MESSENDGQTLPQSDQVLLGSEPDASRVSHKTKSYGISIDSSRIRAVPAAEQSAVLRDLEVDVFNQEEFEQGVLNQVDEAIAVRETEELCKGWKKELAAVNEDIRSAEQEIKYDDRILSSLDSLTATSSDARKKSSSVSKHKENKLQQLKKLQAKQKSLNRKLGLENEDQTELQEEVEDFDGSSRLKILQELETKKEQLIKLGQMTPFGTLVSQQEGTDGDEENSGSEIVNKTVDADIERPSSKPDLGGSNLMKSQSRQKNAIAGDLFGKKKRVRFAEKSLLDDDSDDKYIPDDKEMVKSSSSDEQVSDIDRSEGHQASHSEKVKYKKRRLNVEYVEEDSDKPGKKVKRKRNERMDKKPLDDGNYKNYRERMRLLRIKKLMKKHGEEYSDGNDDAIDFTDNEATSDMEFDGGLKIPGQIWHKLYKYQQTGVKWLWELHCQQAGGIVGDEMGLGKTIQIIAFLAGMRYSKISAKKSRDSGLGPVLVVCPVTVLHQWVKEFHKWSPEFRVAILHDTGSYQGPRDVLIKKICKEPGVLVTSYSGMRTHQESLLAEQFDYVLLDEGHKIRNPDAEITLACKQFRTPHRVILSGSPMQNNFRELWSLFDFVFPGKLGTLPVFMTEFSVPITMGGYANASDVQVQTAYKCACVLRDTINPYLLRRLKKDVKMALDLPNKNEQVLFCRLSNEQRQLYEEYLNSREVQSILSGNYKVFPGLIMLRKICNHPDLTSEAGSLIKAKEDKIRAERRLVTGEEAEDEDEDEGYGDWRRAGKMHVVEALLRMWKEQGNRVLLFSQSKQMLNILETFVQSQGYTYRRMDGGTPVASRHPLINTFNEDKSIFVFLLTTRVGGLGVNLVGADRVIIYDPDWNPSTDIQARERAWRIGQKKNVTIYRLLTTGTIEEKIYHRQIFKQFLTNRVLKDPKQRRFFKSNDLYELFTLDTSDKRGPSETSALFAGTGCEVKVPGAFKRKKGQSKEAQNAAKRVASSFSSGKSRLRKRTVVDSGRLLSTGRSKVKETKPERKTVEQFSFEEDGGFAIDERDKKEIESELLTAKKSENRASPLLNTEGESTKPESTSLPSAESSESGQLDLSKTSFGNKVETASEAPEPNEVSGSLKLDRLLNTASKPGVSELKQSSIQELKAACEQSANDHKNLGLRANTTSGKNVASENGKKERVTSDKELQKRQRIKKKRKRKEKKVEGRSIDYVAYKEQYRSSAIIGSGSSADERDRVDVGHQEKFILKNLFKQTGVHSALKHDVIMESGDPDHTLVESEANRVAKQAAVALKRSRLRCSSAASGIPTWTGVSGSSGISDSPPPSRPRFGKRSTLKKTAVESKASTSSEGKHLFAGDVMGLSSANPEDQDPVSSSQLLSKMRVRNNMIAPAGGAASVEPDSENDELIVQIRNFIAFRCEIPGQATTEEVLGEFGSRLLPTNSAVFRSMLRQISDFTRNDDGKGIWRLKEEFR